jgi:hypothetical protein
MEWLIPYKIDEDEPATGAPAAASPDPERELPARAAPSPWAWCRWLAVPHLPCSLP